ncbi:hypothetical protein MHUMG1_10082 [Metarhizium humberi]|uniref:Uncharacterized protein n=1 Tax=Metarhizium humberi TaxID=2596975 RepID=A0A9P8M1X8_9HYPO|nr:hypothetical protein MHUMG1_10082 [Metarhizium humberi]
MSSHASSASSALVSPSKQSVKEEVQEVAAVTIKERSNSSVTICIIREQGLGSLKKACAHHAGLCKRGSPLVFFTTAELLQDTIDAVGLSRERRILTLLFSPVVDEISFHVPSHFKQLKILRCVKRSDGGKLLVHGSSTYNDVRLDKWQAHKHGRHELLVGYKHGVRIKIADIVNLPNWSRCRGEFGDSEKSQLRQHFETLSKDSDWHKVRGPVAAILGIVVGTAKFTVALGGAVGGIHVKYAFGLHALEIGAGGAKFTVVATAAGPAVALGVLAAAAVYFVPWEHLFDWLRGAVSCVWDKACEIWEKFKDWVLCLFTNTSPRKPRQVHGGIPRAGRFAHS